MKPITDSLEIMCFLFFSQVRIQVYLHVIERIDDFWSDVKYHYRCFTKCGFHVYVRIDDALNIHSQQDVEIAGVVTMCSKWIFDVM